MPKESEVTIQEAANLLNVSCPLLIKLLEEGKIPYISVGSQKHIRFQDLMIYKEQQDAQRREELRGCLKSQLGALPEVAFSDFCHFS